MIGSVNCRPSGWSSNAAIADPSSRNRGSSPGKVVIEILLESTSAGRASGDIVKVADPSGDSTVIGKSAFSEVA